MVLKMEESQYRLSTWRLCSLLDAFKKACETAVIISNDSDLVMPIEVASNQLSMKVGNLTGKSDGRDPRPTRPFSTCSVGASNGSQKSAL